MLTGAMQIKTCRKTQLAWVYILKKTLFQNLIWLVTLHQPTRIFMPVKDICIETQLVSKGIPFLWNARLFKTILTLFWPRTECRRRMVDEWNWKTIHIASRGGLVISERTPFQIYVYKVTYRCLLVNCLRHVFQYC